MAWKKWRRGRAPRKVKGKSLPLVCRQFAALLQIGLPLVQIVGIAASQTKDKALAGIWRTAHQDLLNGESLTESLSRRKEELPDIFLEAIRQGENANDLGDTFLRMADYYDNMNHTREKALSVMIYPAFVLCTAAVVAALVLLYAVPGYIEAFLALDVELPRIVAILAKLAEFGRKYAGRLLLLFVTVGFVFSLYGRTGKGHERISSFLLRLPYVGNLHQMAAASQFAYTLSVLLASGTPYLRAIGMSGRAIENPFLRRAVLLVLPKVEAGVPLGTCLRRQGRMPELLTEMVAVGEAKGTLESFLKMAADYYHSELEIAMTRLLSLLEPLMILVLAGVVWMILLSVYVPLFELYRAI